MEMVEGILLTIVTAATPLLFAAIGELIAERAGVLNLGVEGMMAVGAVMGFAGGHITGLSIVGVATGMVAGCADGRPVRGRDAGLRGQPERLGHRLDAFRARPLRADRQCLYRHARSRHVRHPYSGSFRPADRRPGGLRRGPDGLSGDRADHRRLVLPVPEQCAG